MSETLLSVKGLMTYFYTYAGIVKAVDGVSLHVDKGETLGLVGESGSGKTVTAQSILRIVPQPGRIVGGTVEFEGKNLLALRESAMQQIRGKEIAYITQDPTTTLDPVYSVGDQLMEVMMTHHMGIVADTCDRVTVVYAGQVCETGTVEQVFLSPKHPYTEALLTSVPSVAMRRERLSVIPGNVPNLIEPPSGCRFHPRCSYSQEICADKEPALERVSEGRMVHCHRWKEIDLKSPVAN